MSDQTIGQQTTRQARPDDYHFEFPVCGHLSQTLVNMVDGDNAEGVRGKTEANIQTRTRLESQVSHVIVRMCLSIMPDSPRDIISDRPLRNLSRQARNRS